MANYNKVILVGNLTRDPQLSYLPSQTPVVELGLAVNRNWTAQDGQRREEACFIDVRAYGKPAEIINHYMAKGRSILIEGRLQFQQWQAQDGSRRSKHIVIAENFQFLGARGESEDASQTEARVRPPARTQNAPKPEQARQADDVDATANADDVTPPPSDDDIPF